MDLAMYAALFRRYWLVFVAVIVVAVVGTLLLVLREPTSYEGSVLLSVVQRPPSAVTEYQYGEYYNLQASSLLTEQLRGWLLDPATGTTILREAGVDSSGYSLEQLSGVVKLTAQGNAALLAELTHADAAQAERLLAATRTVASRQLEALQQQGFYRDFGVTGGEVVVREVEPRSLPIVLALSAIAGAVLGFIVLLILSLGLPAQPRRHE